jgi:hypothetical protein
MTTQGNTIYSTDLRTTTLVPNSFGVLCFTMDNLKKKFVRKYYKAQNMISDLGGIKKGFILISGILNYFIKEKLFFLELINSNKDLLIKPYVSTD